MKWIQSIGQEEGFTIQEILVVLIISSLLVGFGLSLFHFTSKLVSQWGKKIEDHCIVNDVTQRIALDVQKSSSVSEATDSSLVLEYGIGKQVIYRLQSTSVRRNDLQMAKVTQGRLLAHVMGDSADIVDIRIESTALTANAAVHVSAPWCSRGEFSKSLHGWSATRNRY